MFKVSYIHPYTQYIGNDKFWYRASANRYAKALRKLGYHDVHILECDVEYSDKDLNEMDDEC